MKIRQGLCHSGFTMIEVLIVLIILASLAAIAIPLYKKNTNAAEKAEALITLGAIRQSEIRYYTLKTPNTYAGAIGDLDFDPTFVAPGVTPKFAYGITASTATTFTATATGQAGAASDGKTVTLTEAGAVGGTF